MSALLSQPEFRFWPGGTSVSITNFTFNQTGDQLEFIYQLPEAVNITRFGVRKGVATGTTPTFKGSIQGVDSSGNADGTIKGGGSPASAVFTPSGSNNTWFWQNLDNSYAGAAGEWIALVIAYNSGTIDGSNTCSFARSATTAVQPGNPYVIENDNGSRSRIAGSPVFGVGSSTVPYGLPLTTGASTSFSSASTPDERGVLFNFPTSFCSTYKVAGVMLHGALPTSGGFDITLYDTNGTTVLQQVSVDGDYDAGTSAFRARGFFFDDTLATLNAGSSYRLTLTPTTGSVSLVSLTTLTSADLDAYAFGAAWASGTSRTDAGSWTDDNTTRYGLNLLIADVTQPAGGGSTYVFNIEG